MPAPNVKQLLNKSSKEGGGHRPPPIHLLVLILGSNSIFLICHALVEGVGLKLSLGVLGMKCQVRPLVGIRI